MPDLEVDLCQEQRLFRDAAHVHARCRRLPSAHTSNHTLSWSLKILHSRPAMLENAVRAGLRQVSLEVWIQLKHSLTAAFVL